MWDYNGPSSPPLSVVGLAVAEVGFVQPLFGQRSPAPVILPQHSPEAAAECNKVLES